jgi:hypothetical protein
MNICPICRREMTCVKTGVTVHFGGGHCYAGDRFRCPKCQSEVVVCNNQSYQCNDMKSRSEVVEMNQDLADAVLDMMVSTNRAIAKFYEQ